MGAIRGAISGTVSGVASGTRAATLAAGGSQTAYTPAMRARHAAIVAAHPGGAVGLVTRGSARGMGGGGRRRRMNVGNMKALRRASRRAHGFLKAVRARCTTSPRKPRREKAYVHFKKRRAA